MGGLRTCRPVATGNFQDSECSMISILSVTNGYTLCWLTVATLSLPLACSSVTMAGEVGRHGSVDNKRSDQSVNAGFMHEGDLCVPEETV